MNNMNKVSPAFAKMQMETSLLQQANINNQYAAAMLKTFERTGRQSCLAAATIHQTAAADKAARAGYRMVNDEWVKMTKYQVTTDGENENTEPIGCETHFGVAEILPDGTCRDIVAPTPGLTEFEANVLTAKLNCQRFMR